MEKMRTELLAPLALMRLATGDTRCGFLVCARFAQNAARVNLVVKRDDS
jgi:hypothetical protein